MATRLTSNQKIMGSTPIVSAYFFFLLKCSNVNKHYTHAATNDIN